MRGVLPLEWMVVPKPKLSAYGAPVHRPFIQRWDHRMHTRMIKSVSVRSSLG